MPVWRAVAVITHPSLGGDGTNTWHVRSAATPVDPLAEAFGAMELVRQFYVAVGGVFPSGTNISWDGGLAGVGPDEGEFGESAGWSVDAAGTSDPLPPATALVVGWRGASGDRSRRGRTFLGPLGVNTLQDNGTPTESVLTEVRAAAQALVDASTGENNGAVGVWSRQESLFRDFVATSTRNVFATLRSRRD